MARSPACGQSKHSNQRFTIVGHPAAARTQPLTHLYFGTDVGTDAIAANKRAIDRFNQKRNDAIEKMDEALLARLASVPIMPDAWHNSESAGAMIDRLSILSLKRFHMDAQTRRSDVSAEHVSVCREKLRQIEVQRSDLASCFDRLLSLASEGRAFWRVYRQFKMYNSPETNPYLYGGKQ